MIRGDEGPAGRGADGAGWGGWIHPIHAGVDEVRERGRHGVLVAVVVAGIPACIGGVGARAAVDEEGVEEVRLPDTGKQFVEVTASTCSGDSSPDSSVFFRW